MVSLLRDSVVDARQGALIFDRQSLQFALLLSVPYDSVVTVACVQ